MSPWSEHSVQICVVCKACTMQAALVNSESTAESAMVKNLVKVSIPE